MAALKVGEKPVNVPKRQPKLAPIKKVGTISPPLKPAPRVRAVKMIFKRKASGATVPSKHLEIILTPVPL